MIIMIMLTIFPRSQVLDFGPGQRNCKCDANMIYGRFRIASESARQRETDKLFECRDWIELNW